MELTGGIEIDQKALTLVVMYFFVMLCMAAYLLDGLISFVRRLVTCQHLFRAPDLQPRDSDGFVTWPCSKCGKVFKEPYGLRMAEHGLITGPWGTTRES